ncbi:MAG: hypothetical protein ACRCYY_07690 [Trueperaceae bacterium]
MNPKTPQPLNERLTRSDFVQITILFFALLVFVLVTTWPNTDRANNSWFIFTQARMIALTFLALAYGAGTSNKGRLEQRTTLSCLLILAVLSFPLELASYAASYPSTPVAWSFGITLLDTVALFGIGLAIGHVLSYAHARSFISIAVVLVIVGLFSIDQLLNVNVFNPLTTLHTVSPFHLAAMSVLAMVTTWTLVRRQEIEDRRQETA